MDMPERIEIVERPGNTTEIHFFWNKNSVYTAKGLMRRGPTAVYWSNIDWRIWLKNRKLQDVPRTVTTELQV